MFKEINLERCTSYYTCCKTNGESEKKNIILAVKHGGGSVIVSDLVKV